MQSFKKTGLKLYEKLQSQGTPLSIHLRSENDKVQKVQKSDKKYGKDYMKSSQCGKSDKKCSNNYTQTTYAHPHTMKKTRAKFQNNQ